MISMVKGLTGAAMLVGVCSLPHSAEAWIGGVFIAPPLVIAPPPVYYPPPAYYPPVYAYPPQPYAYAPPAGYSPAPALTPEQSKAEAQRQASLPYGQTCYAGFYTCAAPANTHVGTGCSCPGIGAPSYGTVN